MPLLWAFCFLIDKSSQTETSLLGSPDISAPPDSDPDPQALLSARQREYKLAALNAKRAGDLDRARELMRIGKVGHLTQKPCVQSLVSQMGLGTCQGHACRLSMSETGLRGSVFSAGIPWLMPTLAFPTIEIWRSPGGPGEGAACGPECHAPRTRGSVWRQWGGACSGWDWEVPGPGLAGAPPPTPLPWVPRSEAPSTGFQGSNSTFSCTPRSGASAASDGLRHSSSPR